MTANISPEAFAYKINKAIRIALGEDTSDVSVNDIIHEFAPKLGPNHSLDIVSANLDNVDGALLPSEDGKKYFILVNENISSKGRYNFTLAHEFGHFLMHTKIQKEFSCSNKSVLGLSKDAIEVEANTFASQLILPNDIVRKISDNKSISLDNIYGLSQRQNSSLSASAIACVRLSIQPIGFVCVRDGFIKWGIASESARRAGLLFKSSTPVPETSAANFEDGDQDRYLQSHEGVLGWSPEETWKEDGFYSARYDESYILLFK